MKTQEKHWLTEDLKSIRNRVEIALILIELKKDILLPTILEDLFAVAQHIIDSHCIKRE